MKRNTIILAIVALVLAVGIAAVASATSHETMVDGNTMAAANQLYEAGHYPEAIQMYEQLLDQGLEDSALLYNLGNAYYQQSDTVQAIINYQHAAQLAPRDPDIRANLELALSQAPIPMQASDYGRIGAVAEFTQPWLSLNELALISLGSWFLLGLLILAWRGLQPGSARTVVQYATVVTLALVLVSVFTLGSRMMVDNTQQAIFTLQPQIADLLNAGT